MSKKRMQLLAMLLVAVVGSVSSVSAAVLSWKTQDGLWSDTAGWGTGVVPGSADYGLVEGGKTVTINYAAPTVQGILAGMSPIASTGTINIVTGGSITSTVKSEIGRKAITAGLAAEGWLNISGGSFTSAGTAPLSIGDEVSGKHTTGHLTVSAGSLNSILIVGSNIAGDSGDTMTVIGDAATITGATFDLKTSGSLSFLFDATGISTMAYTGAATTYAGAQIIVDGASYAGGAGTFNLITAGTLGAENATVSLINFDGVEGVDYSYDWNTTDGVFSVTVVPEPATIGMVGLGALALMLFRRRMSK